MRKLIALFLVLLAVPTMAADLELRAKAGTPGYVDADTIDVSTVMPGEKIVFELVLNNLDFTLAGFEGEFLFPTWLVLVDTAAVGTPDAPFTTEFLTADKLQKLPADDQGNDTATTFRNDRGTARVGVVVTSVADRPSSGDIILAEFCFIMGSDFYSDANCISAAETVSFLACNTGASNCHIVADDTANAVNVNFTQAGMTVDVINSGTTFIKGDVNGSGSLTTLDVGPLIRCAVFGLNDASCPLMGAGNDEQLIKGDCNCSGNISTLDIGPCLRRAVGINSRPATKRLNFMDLAERDGVLTMPGQDSRAMVVGVELQAQGKVKFIEEVALDEAARERGWNVIARHDAASNVFKYILVNMRGENDIVPDIQIPYELLSDDAKVALRNVESYAADNSAVRYQPEMNRYDLRSED